MSILWANGDRGWKSTLGKQSSGQHFLTLYNNFSQLGHPLQEKIRLVCIFSQFCFIPGEQMSTLWTNGHRGWKSTWWQQQYSLTSHKKFTQLSHHLQINFGKLAFFHNFASFQVNKCPFLGQMETGAENLPRIKNLSSSAIIFKINFAKSVFFTILLHSRWTNVHVMGKWRQGLKIDLRATKQRTALFNLVQEFYPAWPSSSRKNSLSLYFFIILLHSRWTNVRFMDKWKQGLKIDLMAIKQRIVLFNLA